MITENEMLKKMLHHGQTMRYWQKRYYAEKDREKKHLALIESKNAERVFDSCITNFKQLVH